MSDDNNFATQEPQQEQKLIPEKQGQKPSPIQQEQKQSTQKEKLTPQQEEALKYKILNKLCSDHEIFLINQNVEEGKEGKIKVVSKSKFSQVQHDGDNQQQNQQKNAQTSQSFVNGQKPQSVQQIQDKQMIPLPTQAPLNPSKGEDGDQQKQNSQNNSPNTPSRSNKGDQSNGSNPKVEDIQSWEYDSRANPYINYIKYFIFIVLGMFIFGGITGFGCVIWAIRNKQSKKQIRDICFSILGGIFIIICSAFFWTYVVYGDQRDEKNPKFYGINALTFTLGIYIVLFAAACGNLLLFNKKSEAEKKNALSKLETPIDQLYFETIDGIDLQQECLQPLNFSQKKFKIFKKQNKIKEQSPSPILQDMTIKEKYQTIPKKWNKGETIFNNSMKDVARYNISFFISNTLIVFYILMFFADIVAHLFLPIYYLSDYCEDTFDKWNLAAIVLVNLFYVICSLISFVMQFMYRESFFKVRILTSLLEIKNVYKKQNAKRLIPSLNIFCIQSIKTWFGIRYLSLNVSQIYFKFTNIMSTIEVITFLSLSSILLIDYYGTAWEKNQISSNILLLSMVLTNILNRFFLHITPIFFNFSIINGKLQNHKEQIYSIKNKLQNISHHYKLFRKNYQDKMNEVLKEHLNIEDLDKELEKNVKWSQTKIDTHEIEQLRAIFEIIRNAELNSTKQSYQLQSIHNHQDKEQIDNNNQDYLENQKIKNEIEYLTQLIRAYKVIYKDMIIYEDKHLLKFLGIFTISYGKVQAFVVIIIPAFFSFLFSYLTKKIE